MSGEPATLIILAGGEAKRMGFPKHQLLIDGRRVLDKLHDRLSHLFVETIVVGCDVANPPPGVRVAEDRFAVRSPLVGIHAGLTASLTHLTFIVACDMPYVEPSLVEYLLSRSENVNAVVPIVRSYYEPLCAVYRRTCLEPIERLIGQGMLKVSELYRLIRLQEIGEKQLRQYDSELRSFVNLNTSATIEETARQAECR